MIESLKQLTLNMAVDATMKLFYEVCNSFVPLMSS